MTFRPRSGALHGPRRRDTYRYTMGGVSEGEARADVSVGRSLLPASEATPAALVGLADRLRRLAPSHRHPERFHEDKSEIERELRRLARRITHG